ncbi:MAG: phosphoribosylamine--glycine ligase [Thermoanaerobaculales bacterium]|jgi:phosphoribosylamine--glycine ligase|nr:phosphoribosylamine--glycine ligase [Thermoanaerobaculales bacterium]
MRVLVLGSGAREHAMVWALAQSPSVETLFAAPGNPGMAASATLLDLGLSDLEAVADAATEHGVDLTVVGPEAPLADGIGDVFASRGLRVFGPVAAAAELEASKVFAKEFCLRHGIPTAAAETVATADEARRAAEGFGYPVVLKADGLAAGKGVLIVTSPAELEAALDELFVARRFGSASDRVLVEECLVGTEVSFMVISDGTRWEAFATSHDYKRVGDGDSGPNTGGMGSHSPAFALSDELRREIVATVIEPTIAGMAAEGREYRGILYAGLMLTADGPRVLEFNCRLGDPETQSVLRRLDGDLAEIFSDAADGHLTPGAMRWIDEPAACVVLAAEGYPESPRVGDEITGVDRAEGQAGVTVFHAGTRVDGSSLLTSGGRVLSVTAIGDDLADAVQRAYRAADEIVFAGAHRRSDIGADTLKQR